MQDHYDYIISGAGCAGLSLAVHMIRSGKFRDKMILLIDQDSKKANDRTWCFWEKEKGLFEEIVFRHWGQLWYYDEGFSKPLDIAPYRYKMVRGIDFYDYCLQLIREAPNFSFLDAKVEAIDQEDERAMVKTSGGDFTAGHVFNSIIFQKPDLDPREIWMLQHFKGWTIHTDHHRFDALSATLMDFRISQQRGTAFCYVLPFSSHKALVEYTLFSPHLLQPNEYDTGLKHYLEYVLGLRDYTIEETEFGVIPMTNHAFSKGKARITNLGTAGGRTKGSSGYTFQFIQKHSAELVNQLVNGKMVSSAEKGRFQFYDSVLLHILYNRTLAGHSIFTSLFRKNKASKVMKFLDNETTLQEELGIISTLPAFPFLKAAIRQML
jgi:lycopene beta-cyclase